ncbi:MAG: hypothetical protein J1E78_06295 [Muribaculaceae bacterium]|nr:hypothetical protein [Muribaculaceae bacterium]
MTPRNSIFKSYLRWRHSKGYGVHSPFAFRFVNEVVKSGIYGFYGYSEIDHEILIEKGVPPRLRNEMRLLLRILNFLDIKRVVSIMPIPRFVSATATILNIPCIACNNQTKFKFNKGDILILPEPAPEMPQEIIMSAIETGVTVYALKPSASEEAIIRKPIAKGLLLTGKNKLILIPRQEMEYVDYDVKF